MVTTTREGSEGTEYGTATIPGGRQGAIPARDGAVGEPEPPMPPTITAGAAIGAWWTNVGK
jgi:hypothetical protein